MKKLIFATIVALNTFTLTAQEAEKGIQFAHSGWSEILARAKQENKVIVLDAFTTWCGPCKWMAKNVFTNDTVAEYYNKTFVCAKIDMEKGEGPEIAKHYGIQNYPTILYINGDGNQVHRTCGVDYNGRAGQKFIQDGKTALDPEKCLGAYKVKYDAGKLEASAMPTYLNMLQGACMSANAEAAKYLSTQNEKDLISRSNWTILRDFVQDPTTREFTYLKNNSKLFEAAYTKDSVEEKILGTYVNYYQSKKDWVEYAKAAETYVDKRGMNDAEVLNSFAWSFYKKITDPTMLQKAARWSKHSTELNDNYAYNDTYAALLFKIGNKEEAKKAAEKAIDLAKKNKEDYKETEMLLEKINGMK